MATMNRAERRRLEKANKKAAHKRAGTATAEDIERSKFLYNEALALQQKGDIAQAISRYKGALKLNPRFAEANNNLGNIYEAQGKWPEAEAVYRRALNVYPENVTLLSNLGNVLRCLSRLDEASEHLEKALASEPNNVLALNNMGSVLLEQAKTPEAIKHFKQALELNPAVLESYINLSAALEAAGRYGEALPVLEQALQVDSQSAVVYYNYGHVLNNLGKLHEAIAMYEKAIALKPNYVQACFNLANLKAKAGMEDEAIGIYRNILAANPKLVEAYLELAAALSKSGKDGEAIKLLTKARQFASKNEFVHYNLANTFSRTGASDQAITSYLTAIKLNPSFASSYVGLGQVYASQFQYDKAVEAYRDALVQDPDNGAAYLNLAGTLHDQGYLKEAIQTYRSALQLPGLKEVAKNKLYSNYLLVLNYSNEFTQEEVYKAHKDYAGLFETTPDDLEAEPAIEHSDERKIRIGYVSTDFREHSVVYFIAPLLENYSRDAFEVYCYSDVAKADSFTRNIQTEVDGWRDITGVDDDSVTDMIRRDHIDILVDLNGHTAAGPRLPVFASKPAPLQVTYLGYPNTTGLSNIDYRISDVWSDPDGQDQYYSEELFRLEEGFLCYQMPQGLPDVNAVPALTNGYITFGSFNNLSKMIPDVMVLWSQILAQIPDSRLILKNKSFRDQAVREHYLAHFGELGIEPERLELIGWQEAKVDHLRLYQRIDICLDTFPYNGTTTTCEAFSMGVPVITLCGVRHAARVGTSLLHQVELPELIAESEAEYVQVARDLAGDLQRLRDIRAGLRERMQGSLCNAARFCERMEAAYRKMWQSQRSQ
jgi:protein O-GlcNAc transferase